MTGRLIGFFAPWAVFAGILALHLVLPARRVAGYVRDEKRGERLRYRLNGPLVFVVTLGAWFAAGWSGVMPWDWLWQHRWPGAAGAMSVRRRVASHRRFHGWPSRPALPPAKQRDDARVVVGPHPHPVR